MSGADEITIMLGGDVMLGRGLDQILPHPGSPVLYEDYMRSALGYVALAEKRSGPIPRPASFAYPWGDALAELEQGAPDLRIVNLETAVTRSDRPAPKGINYRMSPDNLPCLTAAGLDCCVLANNHVLDWGREGLRESLEVLREAGIAAAGAGRDAAEARAPAVLELGNANRLLVYAAACGSSGVPADWAAAADRPGIWRIDEPSESSARALATHLRAQRHPGDLVLLSVHWGSNWGYEVSERQQAFARLLLSEGAADVVHGHSSHHFKGIELLEGRAVFYGCGDLLNDYEGISGHEDYRSDLVLLYLLILSRVEGRVRGLYMLPFRIRRFRLSRASRAEVHWIAERLNAASSELPGGVRVQCRASSLLEAVF